MSKGAFADVMRVRPNPRGWPEGTVWEPLESNRDNTARYGLGMGRVTFPDHDERAVAWARQQTEATWATMTRYFNESARTDWLKKLASEMKAKHDEPLARFEADWWAARQDALFNDCFGLHFDETDPNKPLGEPLCTGLVYTREVAHATTPAPLTQSKVLKDYLAEMEKDASDPSAVMLRAMVANQAELLPKLQAVLAIEPGLALKHLHEKRNDKLYDLGAGMLLGAHGASNPTAVPAMAWLGNLLVFGAVICEASYAVIGKKLTGVLGPRRITALINLWGFALVTPFGLYMAWRFDFTGVQPGIWLLLVFYSLAASVWTVWLWMTGLKVVPAAQGGVFTVLLPVSAALVGVLVLGERFTPLQLLAFGLALASVVLATLPSRLALRVGRGAARPDD